MIERAAWDHDIDIRRGSLIAVQCGDRLRTCAVTEVSTSQEPIVPRPPMPPWWRPFARWRWRRAPVGPTMPVTRLRTEAPWQEALRRLTDS